MRYLRVNSRDAQCRGVNLNRNFAYKWMVSGSSLQYCSNLYAGPFPESELEVKSLIKYVMIKPEMWLSYISIHTFGSVWMAPFSYSSFDIPDNFQETCEKAHTAIKAIKNKHNYEFAFESASHKYEASGVSVDWAKAVAKINFTLVIELQPDTDLTRSVHGKHYTVPGFLLPEHELDKSCEAAYDGFIVYIKTFLDGNISSEEVEKCEDKLKELKKANEERTKKKNEKKMEGDKEKARIKNKRERNKQLREKKRNGEE